MTDSRRKLSTWTKLRAFLGRNELPLVWGSGVLAVVLGCWGYCKIVAPSVPRWEILYRSLQLFALQAVAFDSALPWQLEVARFLAPAVTVYTALTALHTIFSERLRLFWLRVWPADVVICGLGRKGLQLARDFANEGGKVVAIDSDEHNDRHDLCRDLGALVLVGDASEPDLLRNVQAQRARHVVATCGDDGINVEIAVHVQRLRQELSIDRRHPMQCYVHIVNPILCDAFKEHPIFRDVHDEFAVHVFNIFDNSARLLLEAHPLDREHIGPEGKRAVHLVIIGFGKMGQSLALQAAKIGHFANGKKLRLTVVDRVADEKQRSFFARYPQFGQVCDSQFFRSSFEDVDFFRQLDGWAQDTSCLTTIAVCLDNDSASLICALALSHRLILHNIPVLVRMEEDAGLASLLECERNCPELVERIESFGQINRAAAKRKLMDPDQDQLAKVTHEEFRKRRAAEGRAADDPSMRDWEHLGEGFKDSNRQFADHIPVKLRAVRCGLEGEPAGASAVTKFNDTEAEVLARMEHARWNAERFLAGWTLGPSDKARRVSPHLVAWQQLPDNIKKYDDEMVQFIPELMSRLNKKIHRRNDRNP